jgi:RES domain-containing protein
VTAQRLDRILTAYRIGDPDGAYPIFDAGGSRIAPGRLNTENSSLIYASQHFSTAMLEIRANGIGRLPPNQHFVEITIPNGVSYEAPNGAAD